MIKKPFYQITVVKQSGSRGEYHATYPPGREHYRKLTSIKNEIYKYIEHFERCCLEIQLTIHVDRNDGIRMFTQTIKKNFGTLPSRKTEVVTLFPEEQ